jgi:hypothetical protein
MGQREKLSLVYDADGSIGVVMEFSESDFEAYSMPDLALVGGFQTKAQAAQALLPRRRSSTGARAGAVCDPRCVRHLYARSR